MAVLDLVFMGHPVLRRRAVEIEDAADPNWATLAADMIETMDDAGGVGLAAPQVDRGVRLIVFRVPPDRQSDGEPAGPEGPQVLINPDWEPVDERGGALPQPALDDPDLDIVALIEDADDVMDDGLEGCLSIPGLRGLVPRFSRIRYTGVDLAGRPVERVVEGFHARVVQHEIDHLDGILFIDRMPDMETLCFESELHHLLEEAPVD